MRFHTQHTASCWNSGAAVAGAEAGHETKWEKEEIKWKKRSPITVSRYRYPIVRVRGGGPRVPGRGQKAGGELSFEPIN